VQVNILNSSSNHIEVRCLLIRGSRRSSPRSSRLEPLVARAYACHGAPRKFVYWSATAGVSVTAIAMDLFELVISLAIQMLAGDLRWSSRSALKIVRSSKKIGGERARRQRERR
jgi:hypothetical protein